MAEQSLPINVTTLPARISGYIKAHERLLIVLVGAVVIWIGYGKVQDIILAHDQKVLDRDKIVLQAQVEKNATLASNYQTLSTNFQQLSQTLANANAQLEQQNSALATALAKRQSDDKKLPPTALAQRVEELASLPPDAVLPQPNGTFAVSNDGLGLIAAALEPVPVLQQELDNTRKERDNDVELLAKANESNNAAAALVDGLHKQLAEADKTCKDNTKVAVDKASKGKRKWFVAGFIVGVTVRFAAKYL